ncbi:MAG: glyoxalase, partial [Akkermansiaceae bacterium]
IHGGGEGKRTWTGLSFQCDDVLAAVEKLKENGGGLVREPEEEDGMVHLAFCIDTEGNEIMLTQKRA